MTEILVLYSAKELFPAQQRAIQLSHNAIAGQLRATKELEPKSHEAF